MVTVRFSAKVLLAVTIILWEITIVYYLFENRAPTLNMRDLSKDKLENYTLVHGGATKAMFRREGNRKPGEFLISNEIEESIND